MSYQRFEDDPGLLSAENMDQLRYQMIKVWGLAPNSFWDRLPSDGMRAMPGDHVKEVIRHHHNSHGFRDDEIIMDPDICYYGCSFTFGDGVKLEHRWTNQVDQMLGFRSNNFGVSGMSTEGVCDLFLLTSKLMRIPRAVILWPDWFRYQMPFVKGQEYRHWTMFPKIDSTPIPEEGWREMVRDRFMKYTMLPEEHFVHSFKNCISLVRAVAEMNGTDLWMSTWSDYEQQRQVMLRSRCRLVPWFENDWLSVDQMHPGPHAHARFAEQVARSIV